MDNDHGIFYSGDFTLVSNHTLPTAQVTFENPHVIPESLTLTIPVGATLQNYEEGMLLDVRGNVMGNFLSSRKIPLRVVLSLYPMNLTTCFRQRLITMT